MTFTEHYSYISKKKKNIELILTLTSTLKTISKWNKIVGGFVEEDFCLSKTLILITVLARESKEESVVIDLLFSFW